AQFHPYSNYLKQYDSRLRIFIATVKLNPFHCAKYPFEFFVLRNCLTLLNLSSPLRIKVIYAS
ncbi:hypothetical protein, partial [Escherichia coli]|uniref:hypothetical protein n=1 Tax=Escherichia coli TaxID=562 RepID=UPI00351B1A4A